MEWFLLLNCSVSSIIVCLGTQGPVKGMDSKQESQPLIVFRWLEVDHLTIHIFFDSGRVWKDTLTVSSTKDDSSSCRKGCCCCSLIHFAQSFISRSGPPCGKVGIEESLIHSVASPFGPFQSVCNLKFPSGWSLEIGSGQHTQGAHSGETLQDIQMILKKQSRAMGEVQEAMVGLGTSFFFRPIASSS